MTKYYFVRHGESTANVDNVSAGWSDVALTDKGRQQALKTANEIKQSAIKFDVIISSPLSRALDTAKIIAEIIGYSIDKIRILDSIKEKSAGTLELGPLAKIFEQSEDKFKMMGGENAQMFHDRVKLALNELSEMTVGLDTVLIVAHSGVYKMSTVILKNLGPATAMYDIKTPKNSDFLEFPLK